MILTSPSYVTSNRNPGVSSANNLLQYHGRGLAAPTAPSSTTIATRAVVRMVAEIDRVEGKGEGRGAMQDRGEAPQEGVGVWSVEQMGFLLLLAAWRGKGREAWAESVVLCEGGSSGHGGVRGGVWSSSAQSHSIPAAKGNCHGQSQSHMSCA